MDHATPFYSKPKIQKIPELYKHEVAKLAFHHYHRRLPPLLSNLYIKTIQVSQKCTRSSIGRTKVPFLFPNMDISIAIREDVRKNTSVKKSGIFVKY